MDRDLEDVYLRITQANRPEDLFGADDIVLPPTTLQELLGKKLDGLKAKTDPSRYQFPEDKEAASEARAILEDLYTRATDRIRHGFYGIPGYNRLRPSHFSKSFNVGRHTYHVGPKLKQGERSTLYEGFMEREGDSIGEVVIKLVNNQDDNYFPQNEARVLDILHASSVPQWKHLPFLLDRFQSGGRVGLVLRKTSGYTLSEVMRNPRWKQGVDRKHLVWMLDRTLSCLGYVHRQGIVHGDISPDQIIIQPPSHNAILIGWGSAVHRPAVTGQKVEGASESFAAPEVKERGRIGPWSDVYSLGKTMIWLLGGNIETDQIPDSVEEPIADFLRSMTQEDYSRREEDAWVLYQENCRIKDSLWERKFLHFEMS